MWRFLKKLKTDLPYGPAIALLGIDPRDTGVVMRRGTCTPMFIAALSTIAKLWKEPKCPPTDECIKKLWFIYTMEGAPGCYIYILFIFRTFVRWVTKIS